MITVMTATGANRLVENSIFAKHNLKAFIPAFKVLRTGLIQDVPQQFDLDTIKEGLESPRAKILNIQRLNRKITIDNKTKYVPSRTIRIKFAGQILPKEVQRVLTGNCNPMQTQLEHKDNLNLPGIHVPLQGKELFQRNLYVRLIGTGAISTLINRDMTK
ncbi:PREDICTED: uncharacterized protein LOC108774797 [Cyphomyrmex costatus]|uniref:uncharacterized protein LOC108774797 n=1 Tax=Cyphomyrmex costatus TaxID=456900 RepID=UPI000852251F|nr:PREDICTED: uncharacterized protein LOC108774797 [Cyphomyrmex costatus]